ncbi:hypothetical protein RRG08_062587 [Elysia crispata]|uniref:Uncharacterized protein n=1 Tax=Elysia crispata TaxID=231223 RepID=A0AAE0YA38_9GAST|nr:hypothetical protein RRG08_062587 [Elysia crispata]
MSSTPPKNEKCFKPFEWNTPKNGCSCSSRALGLKPCLLRICSADISIFTQGAFDITSHIASAKHKKFFVV